MNAVSKMINDMIQASKSIVIVHLDSQGVLVMGPKMPDLRRDIRLGPKRQGTVVKKQGGGPKREARNRTESLASEPSLLPLARAAISLIQGLSRAFLYDLSTNYELQRRLSESSIVSSTSSLKTFLLHPPISPTLSSSHHSLLVPSTSPLPPKLRHFHLHPL